MQRLLAYSFQKGQQMLAPMPPSTHTAAAGWESSAVSNHYHAEALDASSPASAFAPDAASSSSSFSSSSLSSSSPSSPYSSLVESTSLLTSQFSYHAFLGSDKCTPEAWEKTWGVFFSIVFILYLCVVLVRVCDQHLIPSLEVLCKKWGLPEDVAGATLLAFGGSFPELAIHTIATRQTHMETADKRRCLRKGTECTLKEALQPRMLLMCFSCTPFLPLDLLCPCVCVSQSRALRSVLAP